LEKLKKVLDDKTEEINTRNTQIKEFQKELNTKTKDLKDLKKQLSDKLNAIDLKEEILNNQQEKIKENLMKKQPSLPKKTMSLKILKKQLMKKIIQ